MISFSNIIPVSIIPTRNKPTSVYLHSPLFAQITARKLKWEKIQTTDQRPFWRKVLTILMHKANIFSNWSKGKEWMQKLNKTKNMEMVSYDIAFNVKSPFLCLQTENLWTNTYRRSTKTVPTRLVAYFLITFKHIHHQDLPSSTERPFQNKSQPAGNQQEKNFQRRKQNSKIFHSNHYLVVLKLSFILNLCFWK